MTASPLVDLRIARTTGDLNLYILRLNQSFLSDLLHELHGTDCKAG
jgi:hypothetical protein